MTQRPGNLLLRSLAQSDLDRLARDLRGVDVPAGKVLYEPEDPVDTVWFPETGAISIITVMVSGDTAETGMVGCEGAVGFTEASGGGVMYSRALVQAPGRFLRAPAGAYRSAYEASATLRAAVQEHTELLLGEARQLVGCHARHRVERRLAWLLLEAQDRIGGSEHLPLTQSFLADMLAVQRTTVTPIAVKLQEAGLIHYRRGSIEILDRKGLEQAACECYATTQMFRRRIEERRQVLVPA
jgi:CRP-like cAMP-binding protein